METLGIYCMVLSIRSIDSFGEEYRIFFLCVVKDFLMTRLISLFGISNRFHYLQYSIQR